MGASQTSSPPPSFLSQPWLTHVGDTPENAKAIYKYRTFCKPAEICVGIVANIHLHIPTLLKESDDFRIDDLDTADDVIDLSRDKDEVPTLLESVSD